MTRTLQSSAELFVTETPVIPTVFTLLRNSSACLPPYYIPSTKDSGFLSRVDFVVKRYFYFLIGQVQPLPVVVFISMAVVILVTGVGGRGVEPEAKQGAHKRPAFQYKRPANDTKTPNLLDK
tara:strand:- start:5318 stop:5683 length:366 start_codon:yes stop_codon:yes gene_type:complete